MATLKYKDPSTGLWEALKTLPQMGQTIELTATALAAKSTADRAAMYTAGARLLKVLNGDTEVLLGLEADGSTKWLGSNKPIRNLLDNSNFEIAKAGYGGNHGAQAYACDRWKLVSGTASHSNAGLTLNGTIAQVLENAPSGPVTAAASAGTITYDASAKTVTIATTEATIIAWAALYEGSYTADTLPPYTPKGYAAELAECQRYFRMIDASESVYEVIMSGVVTDDGKVLNVSAFDEAMRIQPTVIASGSGGLLVRDSSGYTSGITYGSPYTGANIGAKQGKNSVCLIVSKSDASSWGGTNNSNISIALKPPYTIALSADL